jgi:hypothetical protein
MGIVKFEGRELLADVDEVGYSEFYNPSYDKVCEMRDELLAQGFPCTNVRRDEFNKDFWFWYAYLEN